MKTKRSFVLAAACSAVAALATIPPAQAAEVHADVYAARPIYVRGPYVAPYPVHVYRLGIRTAYVVGPHCSWRISRVWAGNYYAARRVRVCG